MATNTEGGREARGNALSTGKPLSKRDNSRMPNRRNIAQPRHHRSDTPNPSRRGGGAQEYRGDRERPTNRSKGGYGDGGRGAGGGWSESEGGGRPRQITYRKGGNQRSRSPAQDNRKYARQRSPHRSDRGHGREEGYNRRREVGVHQNRPRQEFASMEEDDVMEEEDVVEEDDDNNEEAEVGDDVDNNEEVAVGDADVKDDDPDEYTPEEMSEIWEEIRGVRESAINQRGSDEGVLMLVKELRADLYKMDDVEMSTKRGLVDTDRLLLTGLRSSIRLAKIALAASVYTKDGEEVPVEGAETIVAKMKVVMKSLESNLALFRRVNMATRESALLRQAETTRVTAFSVGIEDQLWEVYNANTNTALRIRKVGRLIDKMPGEEDEANEDVDDVE